MRIQALPFKPRFIPLACALLLPLVAHSAPTYYFRLHAPGVVQAVAPETGAPAPALTAELVFETESGQALSGLAFPETLVGSNSTALVAVLKNTGNGAHIFTSTPVTVTAPFHILTSTCQGTLAPAASCEVKVGFSPTAAQDYSGSGYSLVLNSSDPGRSLPLSGRGTSAGIAYIVAGPGYTLVQRTNGAWSGIGRNNFGQLGTGTGADTSAFVAVPALSGATQVLTSPGGATYAKFADGSWWATGANASGQLGLGTTVNQLSYAPIPSLQGASTVVPGGAHAYAKTAAGIWVSTGSNTYGQLGLGDVTARSQFTPVPSLQGVTSVVSGYYHAYALKADGTWLSTGHGAWGQHGSGGQDDRLTFTANSALSGAVAVSTAASVSFARMANGQWRAAGDNRFGQLGLGYTSVSGVLTFTGVSAITGATSVLPGVSSLARMADGSWRGTGQNTSGQLGLGNGTALSSFVSIPALSGAEFVTQSGSSTFAKTADGAWKAAGANSYGQLATGDSADKAVFTLMVP